MTYEPIHYDFDEWMELAKNDPEEFEAQRIQQVRNLISTADSNEVQANMERLQFQIDGIIRRQKHPLGACIQISRLMNDFLHNKFAPSLGGFLVEEPCISEQNDSTTIIPFGAIKRGKNTK